MSWNMMFRTQTSGRKVEVDSQTPGRFIMLGVESEPGIVDYLPLMRHEAIEIARALLDAAGIKPTPIAQGCDSYVVPPPGEG